MARVPDLPVFIRESSLHMLHIRIWGTKTVILPAVDTIYSIHSRVVFAVVARGPGPN